MKRLFALFFVALMLPFSSFVFNFEKPVEDKTLDLPIVMYHKIQNSRSGKYIVSTTQLENDFKAINDAGFTSVFLSEVIDWVDGKGKLPPKPIVITFDDGQYNNLYYGLDIAKKHNMKMMLYPITSYSQRDIENGDHSNPNYSHMTWEQMNDAVQSGLVEFGNHTHAMHKSKPRFGVVKAKSECSVTYRKEFIQDIQTAQDLIEKAGAPRPTTFAYPFGKYSKEAQALLLELGFRALLTCNEGISKITRHEPECLHQLKRYNRDGSWKTATLMKKVNPAPKTQQVSGHVTDTDFIKWVDFKPCSKIINRCQKAHKQLVFANIADIGTCELLAYVTVRNGNRFHLSTDTTRLNALVAEILKGDLSDIQKYQDNKYYKHYVEAYHAVLDGIIDPATGVTIGAHPIAKGHWHSGYDDFGASRTYGFKRRHLGHDLYGSVGAPILAVEGGTITELGWNRYGGWRVGVRSDDTKRYYYYAHLRKGTPFPEGLAKGDRVSAGDIIGYLGNTGYSRKPNVNMKQGKAHLHFGMQLIFHPSQEDGNTELWIDVYQICKFLEFHKEPAVIF